jgi:hypothetical protein
MGTDLFDELGVDATFTPAAGDPVSLKVSFKNELEMTPAAFEARAWQNSRFVEIIIDDIGREPNRGETLTIDETVYTVQAVTANDGRFCTMAVT